MTIPPLSAPSSPPPAPASRPTVFVDRSTPTYVFSPGDYIYVPVPVQTPVYIPFPYPVSTQGGASPLPDAPATQREPVERTKLIAEFDSVVVELLEDGLLRIDWKGELDEIVQVEFFAYDKDEEIVASRILTVPPYAAKVRLRPEVTGLGVRVTLTSEVVQTTRLPLATVLDRLKMTQPAR